MRGKSQAAAPDTDDTVLRAFARRNDITVEEAERVLSSLGLVHEVAPSPPMKRARRQPRDKAA